MNELVVSQSNVPTTLPELAKFVLVGTEKLAAVKAEIRAIQKVGLAKEVYEQKKREAQEIAEAVQLASVQVGKILNAIPKASGAETIGDTQARSCSEREEKDRNRLHEIEPRGDFKKTFSDKKSKADSIREMGLSQKQAEQFQQMANHEETVTKTAGVSLMDGKARKNISIVQKKTAILIKSAEKSRKDGIANPLGIGRSGDSMPEKALNRGRKVVLGPARRIAVEMAAKADALPSAAREKALLAMRRRMHGLAVCQKNFSV